MTNSANDTDPVDDDSFPQIDPMDPSLPVPPEQDDLPDEADQPEPEQMEGP
jgi:hypothetical protein